MNYFKPVKQEKVVISVRIALDILQAIDERSNTIDISRNELIVQCLMYAIKNLEN